VAGYGPFLPAAADLWQKGQSGSPIPGEAKQDNSKFVICDLEFRFRSRHIDIPVNILKFFWQKWPTFSKFRLHFSFKSYILIF
jgi:hypothetical protein